MMPLLILAVVLTGLLLWYYTSTGKPFPNAIRNIGRKRIDDPKVAAAAMLHEVAAECGRVGVDRKQSIIREMVNHMELEIDEAEALLAHARQGQHLDGNLNARLHKLADPIRRQCTPEQKQSVIEMLEAVAGVDGQRIGPIRETLGRISATLRQG